MGYEKRKELEKTRRRIERAEREDGGRKGGGGEKGEQQQWKNR